MIKILRYFKQSAGLACQRTWVQTQTESKIVSYKFTSSLSLSLSKAAGLTSHYMDDNGKYMPVNLSSIRCTIFFFSCSFKHSQFFINHVNHWVVLNPVSMLKYTCDISVHELNKISLNKFKNIKACRVVNPLLF